MANKTIIVDGITYYAKPAIPLPWWEHPNSQCCTGCSGQYSIELCEKLQRCYEDKIIWVKEGK